MKITLKIIPQCAFVLWLACGSFSSALALEVSIPDPILNAVVRATLQKPNGPLTEQDLLGLINLTAISHNITNLQGLAAAQNLKTLNLDDNRLTDLSSLDELSHLTGLTNLDLSENQFTTFALSDGQTNLNLLRAENGALTNLTLPAGLTKLAELRLGFNHLSAVPLHADMTNLSVLSLFQNQLTNLILPPGITNLQELNLDGNLLSQLSLPTGLTKLAQLIASGNQLTNVILPTDMTNLAFLRLNNNRLAALSLPAGLTNLLQLFLGFNQLTNLTLPSDLHQTTLIDLSENQLSSFTAPAGLTSLEFLDLNSNQLTDLTLPVDMQQLIGLFFAGNQLTNFVLSESLAASGLASVVDSLQNQGIPVFTYPSALKLVRPQPQAGTFQIGISGPPGFYGIFASTNLTNWSEIGVTTNRVGTVNVADPMSPLFPRRFYRAVSQTPPTNMVFIASNTFMMGSPVNEQGHNIFEGPQSTVMLTGGFWIGKFEVTEREYLDVTGTNPSDFPDDLNRPISSVTWFDATNYCWLLTQRRLAAGRISAGSQYRLPTEAEWECAARAGTTTRFSYGDDPDYGSLTNYAWFLDLGHPDLIVHAIGQKLPNPWGIYDVAGNVWEWCQDWYGDQVGGIQTDPQGPVSNAQGVKIIRGGAYDYDNSSSRSASRFFRFANWPDSDVGFRVVLVVGQ